MPVTEEQLTAILSAELGREVSEKEVQDFLHERYPLEDRASMQHDILSCNHPSCGGGTVSFL